MNHIKYSKADILKLEQELLEAIKSSNIVRLNALLHDDLLFVTPDGQTITKQMDLEAHRTKAMVVEEIKSDVEEITFIDNSAIVVLVYNTKGKMMGNAIDGKYKYIRVWNLLDEEWKIIGGSCVKLN